MSKENLTTYLFHGRLIWRGIIETHNDKRIVELDLSKTEWEISEKHVISEMIRRHVREALCNQDGKMDLNMKFGDNKLNIE